MIDFIRDLRLGVRTLVRTPGFALTATTVLALGIGVNTAVFSFANAFFLRPLPVVEPDAIVRVYANRFSNVRYRTYLELRDRNSTLAGLAAFQNYAFALRVDAEVEHAFGGIVTGNYFPLLGFAASRGRLLTPADDLTGAAPAVVLSHAFWVRRFGGAPDAIGRSLMLNGQPFTVVGVAPHEYAGILAPLAEDLWVARATDVLLRPALGERARLDATFHLAGRLKPGVGREQAQADLDAIGRQLLAEAGEAPRTQAAVTVYGSTVLHPEAAQLATVFTTILLAVVALVMLIVCVNLANLVLARATGRDREIAVRQSLGADRARLMRQMLTESLLLSAAGGLAGFGLADWLTRALSAARIPAPVPLLLDLTVDWRVLAFTALLALAVTVGFGLVPAATASRVDLVSVLKGTGEASQRHGRLRSIFLVSQVSMSVLLLVVAGLFIRSFRVAQATDKGFDATNVVTASLDLQTRGYSPSTGAAFIRALGERLDRAPGVVAANVLDVLPLTLSSATTFMLRDTDSPPGQGQPTTPMIYTNAVGPRHFETLRIPLLAGRDFTDADDRGAPGVAIVNETFARRFWPGQGAVGQRLRPAYGQGQAPPIEVVGIVRDSKYVTVGEEPRPFMFRPLAQAYTSSINVMVKTAGAPAAGLSAIRQEVRALDPGLAVFNIAPLEDATSISLLPARVGGTLLAILGLLALALAALGIYGVLSYLVRGRVREIGVRVAVGASPGSIVRLVVGQAMTWTAVGAGIGMALALALTGFLRSQLYGVNPGDPLTLAVVTILLIAVALAAAVVPAVRASRVDPLVALRRM